MSVPLASTQNSGQAWGTQVPYNFEKDFRNTLGVYFENFNKVEVGTKEYEKLEKLLDKESVFYPDVTLPLMAIRPPLHLIQKAISLQEDMMRRESSNLVSQARWDTTLKFDWMCQAVLINPSLEVLQFLHSKGCCLLNRFKEFLEDKAHTATSLIALQNSQKQSMKKNEVEYISPYFAKAYSDDAVKFIFENLV